MVNQGLALAAHFGEGQLQPRDLLVGIRELVVQESPQNAIAWEEYLDTVIRTRPGWDRFYEAGKSLSVH